LRMRVHEITPTAIRARHRAPPRARRRSSNAQEATANPRSTLRVRGLTACSWLQGRQGPHPLPGGKASPLGSSSSAAASSMRSAPSCTAWRAAFSRRSSPLPRALVEIGDRQVATARTSARRGRSSHLTRSSSSTSQDPLACRGPGRRRVRGRSVEERPYRRSPAAPFITSPQQEGRAQAAVLRAADHAGRAAPVRAGLHSPTCGPTRRRCRTPPSEPLVTRPERSMATSRSRALPDTEQGERTRRRLTRRIRPAGDRFRTPSLSLRRAQG